MAPSQLQWQAGGWGEGGGWNVSQGGRLWGGGCAQLSFAKRGRVALHPQQEETEAACVPGLRLLRLRLPDCSQGP